MSIANNIVPLVVIKPSSSYLRKTKMTKIYLLLALAVGLTLAAKSEITSEWCIVSNVKTFFNNFLNNLNNLI